MEARSDKQQRAKLISTQKENDAENARDQVRNTWTSGKSQIKFVFSKLS